MCTEIKSLEALTLSSSRPVTFANSDFPHFRVIEFLASTAHLNSLWRSSPRTTRIAINHCRSCSNGKLKMIVWSVVDENWMEFHLDVHSTRPWAFKASPSTWSNFHVTARQIVERNAKGRTAGLIREQKSFSWAMIGWLANWWLLVTKWIMICWRRTTWNGHPRAG